MPFCVLIFSFLLTYTFMIPLPVSPTSVDQLRHSRIGARSVVFHAACIPENNQPKGSNLIQSTKAHQVFSFLTLHKGSAALQCRKIGGRTPGASTQRCTDGFTSSWFITSHETPPRETVATAVAAAAAAAAASAGPPRPNVAESVAPEAAAAGGTVPFSAGLPDIVLPPTSSVAPLIDLELCSDSFLSLLGPNLQHQQQQHWQQQQEQGLSRAAPPGGAISFFDDREQMHPALSGASDDAYFIALHGPLLLSHTETAYTALSAAKRFLEYKRVQKRRMQQQQEEHQKQQQQQDVTEYLHELLQQERFDQAPYWFRERVGYMLKFCDPPSYGWLVAQALQCLYSVSAAEQQLGCTLDQYAVAREASYIRKAAAMDPAQRALQLTSGQPRSLKDSLKFKRGFPVFPWAVCTHRNETRRFIEDTLKTTEERLTQHFFAARRSSQGSWLTSARFRLPLDEIYAIDNAQQQRVQGQKEEHTADLKEQQAEDEEQMEEADRLLLFEGINSAAVKSIDAISGSWQRPVYILSPLERARYVRDLLFSFGVSAEALRRIHILGTDGFLMGFEDDIREAPPDVHTAQIEPAETESRTETAGAAAAIDESRKLMRMVRGAVQLFEYHKSLGLNGVPHFIDGNIRTLEHAVNCPSMHQWRLYFCDWGFSTFEDKLKAMIYDRVKFLPLMSSLTRLLITPSFLTCRFWALGSTTAPAEKLEEGRMARWLRHTGALKTDLVHPESRV